MNPSIVTTIAVTDTIGGQTADGCGLPAPGDSHARRGILGAEADGSRRACPARRMRAARAGAAMR
ncbi:hypothetical protein ACFJIW_13820 [Tahibacter sp. UC22_41]|uniref:hypothetical protein n=1 Tax=Tahibacter sp. UC22_41 TaxID=3350178 RepID=UPI0036D922F7